VLPADFAAPVIVVQHQRPTAGDYLAESLNAKSDVSVKVADDKERPLPGKVYLAPANYHLMVEPDRTLSLSVDERVNHARPAIDVLFESAAEAYGESLAGLVMTGASSDGSRGLRTIKRHGGLTIVQDPKTAEVSIMPQAAMAATTIDYVTPLKALGRLLTKICTPLNST